MTMISDAWAQLIDPRIREAFYIGFTDSDRRASMIDTLFNMQGSSFADEKAIGIGGLSSSGWNFEDTGRVQYGEQVKGYEETFTHKEFARGIIVERKLIDDNRIAGALADSRQLGDSAFRFREKAAANVFINAFSAATSETLDDYGTDVTGPDGVALCSTAHPTSPSDSTTLTNEGTLSLTDENVATTRINMMNTVDLTGDLLNVMPDEIIVPPDLEDTALKIVRSAQDPDSANNAINPQAGRFSVRVWHYLIDTNAWFMCDSGLRNQHLRWFDRIPLEYGMESDFDTFQAKWRAYMRFSLGWTDWRWVYGQNPS